MTIKLAPALQRVARVGVDVSSFVGWAKVRATKHSFSLQRAQHRAHAGCAQGVGTARWRAPLPTLQKHGARQGHVAHRRGDRLGRKRQYISQEGNPEFGRACARPQAQGCLADHLS